MKYLYHHRTQGLNVEGVHIRNICKALVARGHQVRLVSVNSIDDDFTKVKFVGSSKSANGAVKKNSVLKTIAKKCPEPLFEVLELAYNFYAFFRLLGIVLFDKPDRIYERYSLFLFSSLLISKMFNIPIVYEVNDSAILERLRPLVFKGLAKLIESRIWAKADGIVFVSTRLKEMIETHYASVAPSVVSPNAVDVSIFCPDSEGRRQAREGMNIQDKVVCGFIGCFARWHGVDRFMQQFAPELKRHPRLHLLLLGDGETLPTVRNIVEEFDISAQVSITGNVPHNEVIHYVRAMDFSILPSSNEYGSPMKQFELMATGVPLVAPDYPPVTEVIEDNRQGWIFKRNDFEHCIQRILEIYDQPQELEQKSQAAMKKVVGQHQWHHNVAQLDELYLKAQKAMVCRKL